MTIEHADEDRVVYAVGSLDVKELEEKLGCGAPLVLDQLHPDLADDGMFEGHSRMPPAAWRLIVVWITLWRSVTRSHAPTMTLPGFFGSSITILPVSYSCHSFDTSSRSLLFEGIFVPLSERWRRRAWARLPETSLHIAIAPSGRVRRGQ